MTSFSAPGARSAGTPSLADRDEQWRAALSHLSVPLFGFLGPLVVYRVFGDRSDSLRGNVAEALDFSLLVVAGYLASGVLTVLTLFLGGLAGAMLALLIGVGSLVLCVLPAAAAHRGETYRYPVNWRQVK